MWELFQYTILILPTIYFGYKYHHDFDGVQKIKSYPFLTKLAAILFLSYLLLFLIVGAGAIESQVASSGKYQHMYTYLFPGIGFGLAIFPTEEFDMSPKTVSFIGWMILVGLSINAVIFNV